MTDKPTRDQVLTAEPGPQLDAWVAELVFHVEFDRDAALAYAHNWWKKQPRTSWFTLHTPPFTARAENPEGSFKWLLVEYSRNPVAAFGPLLDKMTSEGWRWSSGGTATTHWTWFEHLQPKAQHPYMAYGLTPSHAMARASVLAMLED